MSEIKEGRSMNGIGLIIVDAQDSFLKVIPKAQELVKRCSFAVECAHLLGIQMIYTEQNPEKLKGTNEGLLSVGLRTGKCFSKMTFSAFGAPGFVDYLKKEGIEHLLIGGIEASVCVYQTIMDALRHDFDVTMLSDCVGGRREEDSWAIVASLQGMQCHRLPSETIFFSLLQTADHPDFKGLSNLVKKYS